MRAYKLDKIMDLKSAVDKARNEKIWISANPLVNKDFFIVTNAFLPFLDENDQFGWPDRAEAAVLVTLAVVADSWPPPDEVVKEIMDLLLEKIPDFRKQPRRAPEIVIAYLLGWPRPDLNKSGYRWERALPKARASLHADMFGSTDDCLTWLSEFVIEFPYEDPGYWVNSIFNLFTSAKRRCECFLRAAPPGTTADQGESLRGNAKRKWKTCHRLEHHLSLWQPFEMPLWDFADRAVRGFKGRFKATRAGGFPTGMLYDLLWHSGERPGRVDLVKVARRCCGSCEQWTVFSVCQSCDKKPLAPQDTRVAATELLILQGEKGGYCPKLVWTCCGPPPDPADTVTGQTAGKCGNLYLQERCDEANCSEPHDRCPLCRTQHPIGLQRRLSKVHFFEGLPISLESMNDYLERTMAAPPEGEFPQQVISKAVEVALKEPENRGQWIETLLLCLDADFVRWIGLVQSTREVDWNDLWSALENAPDRPATPEDLRRVFGATVRLKLSEIFRFEFGLANRDWGRVENYRPPGPGGDGEEEGQE